ncbi:MAG: endonuclease III [Candidatus Goldbacteria bacterium]|nr:endonuclease III [Candidatus Goldiibacteriota bacterium]
MITNKNIDQIIKKVKQCIKKYEQPVLERFNKKLNDPYWVLISCLLSLRTKDETTEIATKNLYKAAKTPQQILKLPVKKLKKIIYKTGFYNNKAKAIINVSKKILEEFNGKVPDNLKDLLSLHGVGRKTANLVLTVAFNKMGICVDTHVHKICNRWGYVKTKTPDETEMELRKKLPKKYWKKINNYLVLFGQNICLSISPLCSKCPVEKYCPKIGVIKRR